MSENSTSKRIQAKDLSLFRKFTFLFIGLTVLSIAVYLFVPLAGAILYDIGTIFLILGVYLLSRNSKHSTSALVVMVLFVCGMVAMLVAAVYATVYPYQFGVSLSVPEISKLAGGLGVNLVGMGVPALFAGVFIALAAYFFDEWFNEAVNQEEPFRTFSYFGVFFLASQIVVFLGYEMLRGTIAQSLWQTAGNSTSAIQFSDIVILVGSILVLLSIVYEIVAVFRVSKRVNNSSLSTA